MIPWDTIITALFGAGGAGVIAGLSSVIRSRQKGKIEREETLIARLDASNQRHKERADDAEKRADEAEKETADEARAKLKALEKAARLKRLLIENGIETDIEVWESDGKPNN